MTIEEALAASEAEPVNDIFTVNPESRTITVPDTEKIFGVFNDGNTERKHFRCPKVVGDSIDLTTLHLYINYQNANGKKYPYLVEDVQPDGDYITFSWLISQDVVAYKGTVKFVMCAKKGTELEWNTTLAEGTVLEGLEATDEVVERHPDIIEQILTRLDNVTEITQDKVQSAVDQYMTDYTAMMEQINSLKEDLANLWNYVKNGQETVTVTYKDGANGAVFSDVVMSVKKGGSTPKYTPDPVREGYVFSGWNLTIAEKATADATYTAVWQKNDSGGGQEPESVVSDSIVIPDMHNTGIENGVTLKELTTSDTAGATRIQITQSVANNLCNSDGVIENYHFNGIYVDFNKDITQTVKFKNCKFTGDDSMSYAVALSTYGVDKGVTFEHCEFSHYKAAVASGLWKAVFDKCYVHDMMQDAYKINHSEIYLKNCYTRSLGLSPASHADGVQIENNTVDVTAHIYNCRFDQPFTSENAENAAIFAKCKDNNIILDVQKCYVTGGNYTIYAVDGTTGKVSGKIEGVVGGSYRYGAVNTSSGVEQTITLADKLFASTVADGKLYVTNYTNGERTLRVVTDVGEKTVRVPKCPTYEENHTQAFSEYPFNVSVDYTDMTAAKWVKCYDGDVLIRTQKLQ